MTARQPSYDQAEIDGLYDPRRFTWGIERQARLKKYILISKDRDYLMRVEWDAN